MARRRQGGGGGRSGGGGGNHQRAKASPKIVENVEEEDDEEIDEDEAFNSEDERMYGHFFTNKKTKKGTGDDDDDATDQVRDDDDDDSDEDSDDDDEDDDEEEEDDDGQYMLSLLDNLDSAPGGSNTKENGRQKDPSEAAVRMAKLPESEYSSTISKKGLTLDNLMQGLEDTQGFKDLQKTFAKQEVATPAPVHKVLSERTQRMIAYESQSKDISRWGKAVQENRQAETLDFKPKERLNITRDTLVDKFEPTTDFEKELEQALEEAGQQDEEAVLQAEEQALQDDLGANRLTMEEYKKRRGQLAHLRALMFYHEQKRHHIKKIKSKKYRKIRKKQRERIKEANLEAAAEEDAALAQELKEKEETARIQERMTLAHKNTSKWAQRVLKRGKNVDLETRRALSAQIKRGDDLRRKMMGDTHSDSDDSNEDLEESARKLLDDVGPDPTHAKSGLFKLSFMQKGMMKQRDKARDEARQLLSELQEQEDDIDDSDGSPYGDDKNGEGMNDSAKPRKEVIASDQEMKKIIKGGELVANSLSFGNSTSISMSAGIEIDLSGGNNTEKNGHGTRRKDDIRSRSSEHITTFEGKTAETGNASSQTLNKNETGSIPTPMVTPTTSTKKRIVVDDFDEGAAANPWMLQQSSSDGVASSTSLPGGNGATAATSSSKKNNKKKPPTTKGMVDVEGAAVILDSGNPNVGQDSTSRGDSPQEDSTTATNEKKITMLSQEELIRRAFATPSNKEIEEEFKQEKEAIATENDPTRKVVNPKDAKEVSGWGSWTGMGAPPPPPPRKLPKKLEPPVPSSKKNKKNSKQQQEQEDPSRKRKDAGKQDVIINQKRLKKMANTYMLSDVPHPYSSRAEYEQAMLGGVGREWNVTSSFKNVTRPEILTRSGKIIQPLSKKAKVARAPAKF